MDLPSTSGGIPAPLKYNFEGVFAGSIQDLVLTSYTVTSYTYSHVDTSTSGNLSNSVDTIGGVDFRRYTSPPANNPPATPSADYPQTVDITSESNYSSQTSVLYEPDPSRTTSVNSGSGFMMFYDVFYGNWIITNVCHSDSSMQNPDDQLELPSALNNGTLVFEVGPGTNINTMNKATWSINRFIGPTDPSSPLGNYYSAAIGSFLTDNLVEVS